MTQYRAIEVQVEAFQWKKQPVEDWPAWMTEFKGQDGIGQMTGIGQSMGILLVPGSSLRLNTGDWVVLRNGKIVPMLAADFAEAYEAVPESEPAA